MASSDAAHIALFVSNLGGGGAQRKMVVLANAFVARGLRVDLIAAESGGVLQDQVDSRIRVVSLGNAWQGLPGIASKKRWRMRAAIRPLVRYLRDERPDVLMATSDSVNAAAVVGVQRAGGGTRLVLRIDNLPSRGLATQGSWSQRRRMRSARRLFPQADRIVAISHGVGEDALAWGFCRAEQLHVIHNPALERDLEKRALESPGHPWLASAGSPVVLGVGRLVPQKDFATLLRAFARVRTRTDARLVILGEGRERAHLEQLADELGIADHVDLPGSDPNPPACMARASVFVLSSAWEGFGNVLVEALATGCPVVSTACPSGPSEILVEGRFGRLVPVGDARALAAAIEATLRDPGDRESRRQRAQAFRVDDVAERYLGVLLD
jgi:glycosyltransferase involved in cell wall biosynthesis